jgi:choline dehydrogenase-like flavoprotein
LSCLAPSRTRSVFDVVVVGGGAAGCVVAARLARSASRSVLLLEAGPDGRRDTPAELRDGWSIACDPFDWGYRSEPNQDGAVQNLWRKRLLGGTSWLTRFSPRGSPGDYDAWQELGNPGWRFDDVLPYLTRIEADTDFGSEPWHGDRGLIPSVRRPRDHPSPDWPGYPRRGPASRRRKHAGGRCH